MTEVDTLAPVAKPAHIPDSAVYDFDMFFDEGLRADPHGRLLDMVKNVPPVFWTPRNGGHWMIMSHGANFKASRDIEGFSSEQIPQAQIKAMMAAMPPGTPRIPQPLPITLDPPEHTVYRAPLNSAFSPKAMMALRDSIRTLANELIDKVKDLGECDFMPDIAEPLPVQVFLKLLGLPIEHWDEYRQIVSNHLQTMRPDPKDSMRALQKIASIMRPTMLERKDNPKDDVISHLWQAKIDGRDTTLEDLEDWGVVLFIAGLDTVMNGMGFGIRHLAGNLDVQDKLRANPKLIPEAAEELLRRYTFTVPPRIVGKDMEFEGVSMKKGERVMLYLPAADLDPNEFPQSDTFDLNRENKVHIAFNTGPHRCVGSHLARIELQILYEQMLERLPQFRLDPSRPPRFHGGNVIGVDTLWIKWDV